ncbi:short-chain alcohol dehydrogenase [gamma proteobacterium HIMB55]|nr:short-chain alcohol dehydrogenase [gamma proteobacterium HIMB55]
MELFSGKTVVVSGGAEGIGFAVAQAVGREGMNVVITDVSTDMLSKAEATLSEQGIAVLAMEADARKESEWERVAAAALNKFGAIHAVMNNAGVGGGGSSGPIEEQSAEDWRWTIDVNLMGVVFGVKTMVPHIKAAGGGWILNVASMAGMNGFPYGGAYNATKLAVAGLSEGWAMELAPFGIHVAALCPGFVKTRIYLSDRVRPEDYDASHRDLVRSDEDLDPETMSVGISNEVKNGIDPDVLAARVIESLKAGDIYIFTHPSFRGGVSERYAMIDRCFESAEKSPIVGDVTSSVTNPDVFK